MIGRPPGDQLGLSPQLLVVFRYRTLQIEVDRLGNISIAYELVSESHSHSPAGSLHILEVENVLKVGCLSKKLDDCEGRDLNATRAVGALKAARGSTRVSDLTACMIAD